VTVGDLESGFYIEDSGKGIPDGVREKIFESGYSFEEGGTGMGLVVVERVVRAHGWDIAVTTGTEGGARFEITDVSVVG
jgi:signal transduction histidine kinase